MKARPRPITAYFATAAKVAAMCLFLRAILTPFPDAIHAMAADHHLHLGAFDGAGRGRGPRARRTSSA